VADVPEIKDGEVIVKEHAEVDRDILSTVAEVREVINDKGYRTIHIRQHDRLQALTLLARISGMLINRQEISGAGGGPVEVEHRDQLCSHPRAARRDCAKAARVDRAADY
jgi:hypothetical protein